MKHATIFSAKCTTFFLTFENIRQNTSYPGNTVKNVDVPRRLHPSEVMRILIYFHQSQYRTFKDYYFKEVCRDGDV